MRHVALLVLAGLLSGTACSQSTQPVGSDRGAASAATPREEQPERPGLFRCEGCETASERDPADLDWRVALAPEGEPGEPLVLSGRVLQPDGVTPAPGVVLYLHQTNAEGVYRSIRSTGRGGHGDGILEGWLVTDAQGRYEIETVRPAPYPGAGIPAHVHVYIKEPDRPPYYADDFVFEGDPFLTPAYRDAQELRAGSGILTLHRDADGTWRGERHLVLEW